MLGTDASLEHMEEKVGTAGIVTSFKKHDFEGGWTVEGKGEADEWEGGGRRVLATLFPCF